MTGIELIAAERKRQIEEEGWTPEHDDGHDDNELAWAAACYAAPDDIRALMPGPCTCPGRGLADCQSILGHREWVDPWPWGRTWDKREVHDYRRRLVIAGALIAAEIDRLQREEASHA